MTDPEAFNFYKAARKKNRREFQYASDPGVYRKRMLLSLSGFLLLGLILYYKSVSYTPPSAPEAQTVSFPDRSLLSATKYEKMTLTSQTMVKRGLADDYQFWLACLAEAKERGNKQKVAQANATIKTLIDRMIALPAEDVAFIQEHIGQTSQNKEAIQSSLKVK